MWALRVERDVSSDVFICLSYLISSSVMLYQKSHTLIKVKIITFRHHLGNRESHDIKYMLVDYWMGYLAFFFSLLFFSQFLIIQTETGKIYNKSNLTYLTLALMQHAIHKVTSK